MEIQWRAWEQREIMKGSIFFFFFFSFFFSFFFYLSSLLSLREGERHAWCYPVGSNGRREAGGKGKMEGPI